MFCLYIITVMFYFINFDAVTYISMKMDLMDLYWYIMVLTSYGIYLPFIP